MSHFETDHDLDEDSTAEQHREFARRYVERGTRLRAKGHIIDDYPARPVDPPIADMGVGLNGETEEEDADLPDLPDLLDEIEAASRQRERKAWDL